MENKEISYKERSCEERAEDKNQGQEEYNCKFIRKEEGEEEILRSKRLQVKIQLAKTCQDNHTKNE